MERSDSDPVRFWTGVVRALRVLYPDIGWTALALLRTSGVEHRPDGRSGAFERVSGQDRALRFFTETLGFETRIDDEFGEGERWIEVAPPGAETTIALVDSQATEVSFATDDAEAAHEELRARGVDADAEVLRLGEGVPAMFTFRDQDGNRYRVVERD